jgi:hypothetical protein
MPEDNSCYCNKPHDYKPIDTRTIGSGENQQQISILKCTRCGDQSPSNLELAGMDAEATNAKSLERKFMPEPSPSHAPPDDHHFEAF